MKFMHKNEVHSVKDVRADEFIKCYAKHLKECQKIKLPAWQDYVKTGVGRERAPSDPDWLYIRAASIIRHLYIRPNQGINSFKVIYGNKHRRGAAPGHHSVASGAIIRYCLQQLEQNGLVEISEKGGRRLTTKGHQEIAAVAKQVGKAKSS